ncbi:MAG: 2-dehydro-3-deoxygalactonokinase [Betaproteobacteria bacterium]
MSTPPPVPSGAPTTGKAALIAIDWGTTSARAYRLDGRGNVVGERSAPLGVQAIRDGAFAAALDALLGDWRDVRAPWLASGMIGSRQGWIDVPYVECPAELDGLALGLVRPPESDLRIVPGVICRDAAGVPDVMRGEEAQIAGAIEPGDGRVLLVLPGTHSKWARIEGGHLVSFTTYMTGELYAVLLAHSILGRLADAAGAGAGDAPGPAFERGVARGLGPGALAHDLFGARTLALTGELAPADVADWLSGLLIGREIRAARLWAFHAGHDAARVRIVGADALVLRYERALGHADIATERGSPVAAARGLWRIARRAGLVLR